MKALFGKLWLDANMFRCDVSITPTILKLEHRGSQNSVILPA